MKKIIAFVLLSALVLLSGCSASHKPKASLSPKSIGTVSVDEKPFHAEIDFSGKQKLIVLKGENSAFGTFYYFSPEKVKLKYDELETELSINELPESNLALLLYRAFSGADSDKADWTKQKNKYIFSLKINEVSCTGECTAEGKLVSIEIPQYKVYYKANQTA